MSTEPSPRSVAMRGNQHAVKASWDKRVTLSVRIRPETRAALDRLAAKSGCSIGALIDHLAGGIS